MKNSESSNLNTPGYLFLSDEVLNRIKSEIGDEGNGTVDELNFSPLYNSIANELFPWCSTLTSRARYLLFTYCTLQIALEVSIPDSAINMNLTEIEANLEAMKRIEGFRRNLRLIEKYLALSLALHGNEDSYMGKRKIERWLRSDNKGLKSLGMILSLDGRYPNAIHRSGVRELGLFTGGGANLTLVGRRLMGKESFSLEWVTAGRDSLSEIRMLHKFWSDIAQKELSDKNKIRAMYNKSAASSKFRGFSLSKAEAKFLLSAIKESTPYWSKVSETQIQKIFKSDVTFAGLQSHFEDTDIKNIMLAGGHLLAVTRPFAEFYRAIAYDRERTFNKSVIHSIQDSRQWLDKRSVKVKKIVWERYWKESYSSLIGDWFDLTRVFRTS